MTGGASQGQPAALAGTARAGDGRASLAVEGLDYVYESRSAPVHALSDINLRFGTGEFICVVGPSGCGKSTLLHLLAGFLEPTAGTISLNGDPITGPSAERAVVFQQPTLYPWMSVLDNVSLGPRFRGVDKRKREETARHFLSLVHLSDFEHRAPYELSGGMQQRVAIARVLANDPLFLLMDEPFGALDALTRERLQEELLGIWRETRKAVFFITHSAEEAIYLATRVLVMSPRPGRIMLDRRVEFSQRASGNQREVRASREFIEAREEIMEHIYAVHEI